MSAYLDTREDFFRCDYHKHTLLCLHHVRRRDKVREAREYALRHGLKVVFRDDGTACDLHVRERPFLVENTDANSGVFLHMRRLSAGLRD